MPPNLILYYKTMPEFISSPKNANDIILVAIAAASNVEQNSNFWNDCGERSDFTVLLDRVVGMQ